MVRPGPDGSQITSQTASQSYWTELWLGPKNIFFLLLNRPYFNTLPPPPSLRLSQICLSACIHLKRDLKSRNHYIDHRAVKRDIVKEDE